MFIAFKLNSKLLKRSFHVSCVSKKSCIGIIGLPNVGKSCLFNALLKKEQAKSSNYPFCTIEPNTGTVEYYDKHLFPVAEILKAKKVTPIPIEFVDIAGLVQGASDGLGLGNKFLDHIKRVSSTLHMVRCFDLKNSDIIHVMKTVDPVRDAKIIMDELRKKDLEIMTDIKGHMRKILGKTNYSPKSYERLVGIVIEALENSRPLSELNISHLHPDFEILNSFRLLSSKPALFVGNIDENSVATMENEHTRALDDYVKSIGSKLVVVCAKLEFDLSMMSDENTKKEFMDMYGMKEYGIDKIIDQSFDLLGFDMFFTMGKTEVRAWPAEKGSTARKCAGKIHSDFEAGFIKAEHWTIDEYIKTNGTMKKGLKSADYILKYGDCFEFRVKG